MLASSFRGLPNDVYFQIGLLTTLGLTTKNAILIVVFAKAKVEEGMGLIEATLEGARLRFRPIVMTSLAFGFGVLPLTLAMGAGAGAQKAIGTCVLGGMITRHIPGHLLHSTLLRSDLPDVWKQEKESDTICTDRRRFRQKGSDVPGARQLHGGCGKRRAPVSLYTVSEVRFHTDQTESPGVTAAKGAGYLLRSRLALMSAERSPAPAGRPGLFRLRLHESLHDLLPQLRKDWCRHGESTRCTLSFSPVPLRP